ncbi:MAG TPA: DoxX family protein [Polyangia bacterium]|jgi:putative oxidoreductase|nr:DoxX family protein [Polyangia bacterium]
MNSESLVLKARELASKTTQRLGFLAPLLIRLTVGLVFIGTGWGKLHSLPDVTEFFTSLHVPFPALNARVVATTEFVGGILLIVGLGSRLIALPLAFTMVIAILTAKLDKIDGITTLVGFEEWTYLVMFLVIALTGPGALSLDALLMRRFGRKRPPGAMA